MRLEGNEEWSKDASDSDAYTDIDSSAENTTDDAKATTTAPLPALVLLSAPGPNVPSAHPLSST